MLILDHGIQGARKANWLKKISEQLLPCAHTHVIFTVPEQLNVFWQYNRRLFAEILLKAARETLTTLLADPQHLGATLASSAYCIHGDEI